ncbi:MAG TPA: hypothetical protein DCP90_07800 [Clostridiales bacterium]|nr:MAG: hypothetical protein A2Y22_05995 [Clostridiales bacterium GWD2_32_59]HAN10502.1 hypothetical protein [Clostridiales bacterium]
MSIRAFLIDFDGTLVNTDILDVICDINGCGSESKKLNEEFHLGIRKGLSTLKERIDFLNGVTLEDIQDKLNENNYLISV